MTAAAPLSPGAPHCTCRGLNRVFQESDGSCICQAGHESLDESSGEMDCQPQVAWAGRQARGCEGSSAQHARHCHQLPGTAQPSVPRGYLLHKQKDLRSPCHRTTEPQTQDGPWRHPEGVPRSTDSRRAMSHVGRRPKRNSVPPWAHSLVAARP